MLTRANVGLPLSLCIAIVGTMMLSTSARAQTAEDPWASLSGQGNVYSLMGAMELIQCAGGARSWNLDQDIQVTVSLRVDGQLVNSNSAWGLQPTANANANVGSRCHAR